MIVAVPMPPPVHIVTSAVVRWRHLVEAGEFFTEEPGPQTVIEVLS